VDTHAAVKHIVSGYMTPVFSFIFLTREPEAERNKYHCTSSEKGPIASELFYHKKSDYFKILHFMGLKCI
jgi:hypothetical protein